MVDKVNSLADFWRLDKVGHCRSFSIEVTLLVQA